MDEVATQHRNVLTVTAGGPPRGSKGKGRRAKEMEPKEDRDRKRIKVDEDSSVKTVKTSIKKPKVHKGRAQLKVIASEKIPAPIEPKWNIFQSIEVRTPPEVTQSEEQPSLTELKPRIWTSSREELTVLLPELAGPKCLNGVSWLMYDTPMVLLDESTACFDIALQEDSVTLDLLTTREFTDARAPMPNQMPDPPESLTANDVLDDNRSGLDAIVTSPNRKPSTCLINESHATAVIAPVIESANPTRMPPEGATSNDVSIPSSIYTPHEPSFKDIDAIWSERPSGPTYSQDKPTVESVGESYGTSTAVPSRPFGDVLMIRRKTKGIGSRKETSEGVSIDFSPPNFPHTPIAEGFNTTVLGHQSHAKPIGNQPFTFTTANHVSLTSSCRPAELLFRHPYYETQPTVKTDTTPDAMYRPAFDILRSPPFEDMESDISESNTHSAAIISDEAARAQLSFTNVALNAEYKVEQSWDVKALHDTFIPSSIPEEIQAIIDSYSSGRPLLLVISNKRFFDYWSLRLPEEFGFSMLGYFRILGVQESRVHLNDDPACPLNGTITGRVRWRFRLRWSPGGEEWVLPNHDKKILEHPWWKPSSTPPVDVQSTDNLTVNHIAPSVSQEKPTTEPFTASLVVESQSPEDFNATSKYQEERSSHVNYQFRHTHLRELYHSHIPLPLLAPYGCSVLDSSFPRGWLCENCGKINFQAALRHRVCSSSFCKGLKPEIAPYAVDLMFMREPQDNLPMVLPYNEPLLIDLVDTWEDGTRTLPYYIHDNENTFIKHIFTCNLPVLQLEATRLLHFIQTDVELVRPIAENSPYFQYSAHAPEDDPSPTTSEWPNVPPCINHAKDWTQHQAAWYGELKEDQLSINHLCLLAWVTSGTKRGPEIIRAKEKCVVFHAFGCSIGVMVTPLSWKTTAPVKIDGVEMNCLISMDELPPDEPDVNPGWVTGLDEDEDAVGDPSQETKERWPAVDSKKASKRPFLVTLVHGDVLVFYGDDFEYSLKRGGTSFLLIASHQSEP